MGLLFEDVSSFLQLHFSLDDQHVYHSRISDVRVLEEPLPQRIPGVFHRHFETVILDSLRYLPVPSSIQIQRSPPSFSKGVRKDRLCGTFEYSNSLTTHRHVEMQLPWG